MTDWDDLFRKRGWGRWPSTRFVEFAMRTYGATQIKSSVRFLELGCGFGAQLQFLWSEGFGADGVDGSGYAATYTWASQPPKSSGTVWTGQLPEWEPPFEGVAYDCVFDVCTLQHLLPSQARETIAKAKGWLKPGGYLWSMWAATGSDDPPGDTPRPHPIDATTVREYFLPDVWDGRLVLGVEDVIIENTRRKHWIIQWQKPAA